MKHGLILVEYRFSIFVTPPSPSLKNQELSENLILLYPHIFFQRSRDRVIGIATNLGLDDREVGVRLPIESRIFFPPRRPNRLWGPLNLLSNGYRGLFPRG
jgi:hypothetical protein